MSNDLDIYTIDGLKVTLKPRLSSDCVPMLFVYFGIGVCIRAACSEVMLVTYDSLPNYAFLEMPGCCISFNPEFLGAVEALLYEAELVF